MTLTVDKLTVRYRKRTAVDAVSWRLAEGFHALLGPNGAGKSSLLRDRHPATGVGNRRARRAHRGRNPRAAGLLPPGEHRQITIHGARAPGLHVLAAPDPRLQDLSRSGSDHRTGRSH